MHPLGMVGQTRHNPGSSTAMTRAQFLAGASMRSQEVRDSIGTDWANPQDAGCCLRTPWAGPLRPSAAQM